MYHKRESGVTVQELAKEYKIRKDNIHYLIRLIEKHGEGILRNDKNRYYSSSLKEEIINKVLLDNHSVSSIAMNMDYHQMVCYFIGLSRIKRMDML